MKNKYSYVTPGKFYKKNERTNERTEIEAPTDGPEVVICRRIEDFEPGQVPQTAQLKPCAKCGHLVVFNPDRVFDAPYHCMQCEDLEPLPIEGS